MNGDCLQDGTLRWVLNGGMHSNTRGGSKGGEVTLNLLHKKWRE